MTFVMDTPMGYVLRTVHPAQLGRGPGYNAHPIPASEALVFLPTNGFPSAYKEDAPPCE